MMDPIEDLCVLIFPAIELCFCLVFYSHEGIDSPSTLIVDECPILNLDACFS